MSKWYAILLILFCQDLNAQTAIPYREGDMWGYKDSKYITLLEPKYEETYLFHSRPVIPFKQNGKFGLLNRNLEEVIDAVFDSIGLFQTYCWTVVYKGDTFNIDDNANKCYKCLQVRCWNPDPPFRTPVFEQDGLWGCVWFKDTVAQPIYKSLFPAADMMLIAETQDGKTGVIRPTENKYCPVDTVAPFIYDSIKEFRFSYYQIFYRIGYKDGLQTPISNKWPDVYDPPFYTNLTYHHYAFYAILPNGKKGWIYGGKEYWVD